MTTKNTNSKLCRVCNVRNVGTGHNAGYENAEYSIQHGECLPCGNAAQHDIQHTNGHEDISEDECWYCHPELNEASADFTPKTGHTNAAPKTYSSHATCKHAVTPAARAKCRKARKQA